MEKTENFNLNKPEPTDLLRVEDFNENADKVDAALNGLNTAVESKAEQSAVNKVAADLAGLIVVGTFRGNASMEDLTAKQRIELVFQPRILIVRVTTYKGATSSADTGWDTGNLAVATRNYPHYMFGSEILVEITETGFISGGAGGGFNYPNRIYEYVAVA